MKEQFHLQAGGHGLGEVDDEMMEKRALELAKADGRAIYNDNDYREARRELCSVEEQRAPEEIEQTRNITAWDENAGLTGAQAPKVLPEDEANMAEYLVEEGNEEAETDRRISAIDEDSISV